MDFETTAKELRMLAGREKLTATELDRAKDLMVELKQSGMSNVAIMELTGGRWSESTAKGYTKGVTAMSINEEIETMRSSLGEVVSFIQDLKKRELTLGQLGEAKKVTADLEAKETSPAEIAGFVSELEQEQLDVPAFVSLFCEWHEAGLTPADARSALSYKAQLEEAGLDIDTLSHIAETAGKFSSPGEVLEAVAKYGNLGQLDEELEAKRKELETLAGNMEIRTQKLHTTEQKMQEVQNKTAALEKTLATYTSLKAVGFDENTLRELAKASEKYGPPRNVFSAINHFGDLSKIKAADTEWRNKIKRKRELLKSLDKQTTQLKEPIELCRRLLERRFGLTALPLIDAAARKYGEPIEVMKAIEAYGALKEIERKATQAKAALAEIEGRIEVLKETYAQQNARNATILDQFETLNAKAIEVGRLVGNVEEQLKGDSMARGFLALLRNPTSTRYEDSLPLILVVLKCIAAWAVMHKSKFPYPSLVSGNLEELLGHLGAG